MLAACDFADDVGALDRAVGEFVLNIDVETHVFAFREKTLYLASILPGRGNDGDLFIDVEAKDAGVREVHAFGLEAEISADDGDSARCMQLAQETGVIAEDGPEILFGFALRDDIDDFPAKYGGVFHFGFKVEQIGGSNVGLDAAGGSGAGPPHSGDGERSMERSEHYGFGGTAGPALPLIPFFGVNILQADGLHFCGAPLDSFLGFGAASDACADFVAEFGKELEGRGIHGSVAGDFDEAGLCGVGLSTFRRG